MDGRVCEQPVKKRGRPKQVNNRIRVVNVRLTEDEFRDVLELAGQYGDTYSDVLRNSLRFFTSFIAHKDE